MLNATSKHLITLFKDRFKTKTGAQWKDNAESGLYFLKHVDALYRCPADKQAAISAGDSSNWDISAIVTAILSIRLPASDIRAKEDGFIKGIKTIRNSLAHASPKEMIELDKEKFEAYFKELKETLVYFGENEIEVDKFKLNDLSYFSSASSNDPQYAILKKEGDASAQAKQFSKAVDAYSKAIMLDKVIDEDRGYLYLNRSDAYYNWIKHRRSVGDKTLTEMEEDRFLNKSLADLKKARQLLPDIPSFYAKKGQLYYEKKELDEALKAFDVALTHDAYNEELQKMRDETYKEVKKFSQAIDLTKLPQAIIDLLPNPDGQNGAFSNKLLEKSVAKVDAAGKGYGDILRGYLLINAAKGRPKYDEVLNWYMKAANKGNYSAMLRVAAFYMEGKGIKKDPQMAVYWLQKVATSTGTLSSGELDPDISNGQFNYGLCLLDGLGVQQDRTKGMELITRAADKNDESALYYLGKRYLDGKDVQQNVKKGFDMLLKAAEKNHVMAMDAVGSCYATGTGTDKDYSSARKWFERAKKRGYQAAHTSLMKLKDLIEEQNEAVEPKKNAKK